MGISHDQKLDLKLINHINMLASSCISYFRRKYYFFIDSTMKHRKIRWILTAALITDYFYRAYGLSYDVITYLIGFYLLQMLVNCFTPQGLEEEEEESQNFDYLEEDNTLLGDNLQIQRGVSHCDFQVDEEKPLVSSINELQIWERVSFAFLLGTFCTFFKEFQIDVFWPLLMIYFIILVCYTVQKIVKKMKKYRYSLSDFSKKNFKLSTPLEQCS